MVMGGLGIESEQSSPLTEERDKMRTKIRDKAKVHRNKCKMLIETRIGGQRGLLQTDDPRLSKRVKYKAIGLRAVKEIKCTWWTLLITIMWFTSAVSCFPPPLTPRPNLHHQGHSSSNIQDALYNSFSAALTQQGMQSILTSIEDRLRVLDEIWTGTRGGIDSHFHQTNRKLDILETKLDRLESVVDSRLESLSARLEYIVPRLERHGERSLQAFFAAERSARACEGLNHRFDKQGEMVNNAEGATHWRGAMPNSGGDKSTGRGIATPNLAASHPPTHVWRNISVAQQEQPSQVETRLRKLEEAAINSGRRPQLMQQDASGAGEMRAALSKETAVIASKLSGMYNELWRRSHSMESLLKDAMALTNATRRETQDGLRSLKLQLTRRGLLPPQPPQPPPSQMLNNMNNLTSVIQRKLNEYNHKIDTKLENIIIAQDLFLNSCHIIQLNEPQIEQQITIVLEKLLETFANRTETTLHDIQLLQGLMKSHDSSIKLAVARVNNAALMSSKHSKRVVDSLDEFREGYRQITEDRDEEIGEGAMKLFGMKIEGMTTILQEIQEQITYTEKQHEFLKANNNQIILDSISVEIYKAVKNFTLSMQSTNNGCPTNKLQEQMIDKLMHLSENLQNSIDNLDFGEDYAIDSNRDQFNDEVNTKRIPNNITNITSPNELIDRLNHIIFEDSNEDVENIHNEVNARGEHNFKHDNFRRNGDSKSKLAHINKNENNMGSETNEDKYLHEYLNNKNRNHRFQSKNNYKEEVPNLEEDSLKFTEKEFDSYKKNETDFDYRDDLEYDDEI